MADEFQHPSRTTIDSGWLIRAENNISDVVLNRRLKRGIYKIEADGLYKHCNRCKEYWPADSEFFFATKREVDGLYPWCKACYLEWRYPNGRKQHGFPAESTLLPEQSLC